jgi:hypothetical protein
MHFTASTSDFGKALGLARSCARTLGTHLRIEAGRDGQGPFA